MKLGEFKQISRISPAEMKILCDGQSNLKKINIKRYLPSVICALIIYMIINNYVFFTISVPSKSMYPTIMPKDRIWVVRLHNKSSIKRGDILVFYSKELGKTLIKRVLAVPNDKVDIKSDGTVYINGIKLDEPYANSTNNKIGIFIVPENKYLFLGDNRANSYDSRYWSNPYIDNSEIKGKAVYRYYPFNRIGKLY